MVCSFLWALETLESIIITLTLLTCPAADTSEDPLCASREVPHSSLRI